MPTFEQIIQNNQPVPIVHVSLPGAQQGNASAFRAILDTGAQRTSVFPNVQNKIGLMPLGTGDMRSASGEITEI